MAVKTAVINSLELGAGDQRGKAIARWGHPGGNISVTCLRTKGSSRKTTCTWSLESCIKEYQIRWWYQVLVIGADGGYTKRWVSEDWKTVSKYANTAQFSIPEGATAVWLDVWMGAEEYYYYKDARAKSKSTAKCFTEKTVSAQVFTGAFDVPEIPEITSAKVGSDGCTIEVAVKDSDPYTKLFQVQGNGGEASATASAKTDSHTYKSSATVLLKGTPGRSYSIRARMQNVLGNWSAWASLPGPPVAVRPGAVASVTAQAASEGAAAISWAPAAGAEWYEIAWASSPRAFSLSSGYETRSTKDLDQPAARAFGFDDLDAGKPWFFWVRGCNGAGDGEWSPASNEVRLGAAPAAPTVWADSYAAVRGEAAVVRWQHNSSDGTAQGRARVRYRTSPQGAWLHLDVEGAASELELPTADVPDGGGLDFCVATWGAATGEALMSPWSEVRRVGVWERPSCELRLPDGPVGFPVPLSVEVSATAQRAVAVSLELRAAMPHEFTEPDGTARAVAAGEPVWSRAWSAPDMPLSVELTPWDASLSPGQSYEASVTCAMSSGLSCSASGDVEIAAASGDLDIEARVERSGEWGCEVFAAAYLPPDVEPAEGPEPVETEPVLAEGVSVSVYRRESDGAMTPLMTGAPNDGTYSVVDSHAPLGRQRYRVAAVSRLTGAVDFEDVEAGELPSDRIIVEWGGGLAVGVSAGGEPTEPDESDGGAGSFLALPWNISVSEDNDRAVTLVEYMGRSHPVAYSGTQLGQTAKWTCAVDKGDAATLALLRGLAAWRGEAYVREPMGTGYWAVVKPSLSASSASALVSVTPDVARTDTRDGGIDLSGSEGGRGSA